MNRLSQVLNKKGFKGQLYVFGLGGLGLFLFLGPEALAQTLRGRVIDRDTKNPLPGANVVVINLQPPRGAVTDAEGYFELQGLPPGRYDLRISFLGYEDARLNQVVVGSGRETALLVEMTERINKLDEITISASRDKEKPLNEMATVSARTFNLEEAQRYAAGFNDPARMALSFAGVATANDASNEIVVRGNSARGLLWRAEGVEIPNPNHFSNGDGGTGGGISILSSQVVGQSDFLTGAFPAEYGNALSGVFDLRLRKGNPRKREFALQLGVLGLQASFEGPFRKGYQGSYLINYRYSTLVILNALGLRLVKNALVPVFQDLSYNIHLPLGRRRAFSIWGIGGISQAGNVAVKDSLQWQVRSDRFEDRMGQSVGATGLTYLQTFSNEKTYLKATVAFTTESLLYTIDSLNQWYEPRNAYRHRYSYHAVRSHVFLNHKANVQHILRAGIYYSQLFYNLISEGLIPSTNVAGIFLDEQGHTGLLQAYGQWKWRLSDRWEINSGIHSLFFLLNRRWRMEPRFGALWRPATRHAFSVGSGLHSRLEPVSTYLIRFPSVTGETLQPNRDLDLTRSWHFVVGYDWSFAENTRLKTELYYQHLFKVPVDTTTGSSLCVLNVNAEVPRTVYNNRGMGRNYGGELTVEKFFSRRYFFLITGSLFQSQYHIGDGRWRNTRFNARYMFNALGGYELPWGRKRQHTWSVNMRMIWRGGNRYTPIDTAASLQQNREVLIQQEAFTRRLPDFFRWDASTILKLNFPRWALSVSLEVQNITNRQNVNRYFFDPYTREVRTAYMFGVTPVLNVKVEF
ncbi:MAG: TonB-dependent receptor [Flavobacteriales bacterium]|nr:TonB-dependent receptor [Flavobacteriales bacterium]MDW8410163.1 TonB-dependent receptor [Flavobacteriales bacterium]